MNRRQFLFAAPVAAGISGCLGLDPRLLISPPIEISALSDANTTFALDLFEQLRGKPGNFVVSPFCVATAIALASAGSAGETLAQFQWVLHRTDVPAAGANGDAALQRQLAAGLPQSGCQLRSAYALWAHRSLHIRDDFRRMAEDRYAGALQTTDFSQPESAVRAMNNWVELQTSFKVKGLVAPGAIPDSARLALASAVYFRSYWARAFPKAMSVYDTFHGSGEKSMALFMRGAGNYPTFESDAVQMVELPFAGGALSILLIMPRSNDKPATLNAELLRRFEEERKTRKLLVSLPRLHLTTELNLDESLVNLGLTHAFQDGDWSRLTTDGGVNLNAVIHKAVLDISEDGAQAELASAISAQPKPDKNAADSTLLAFNRPFQFAIRDATSRSILFYGRVEKP